MPTNMFSNSDVLRRQPVQQMGMDVPKMIQQQWQEAQPRFAEQEQMGRKKFAQDMLEEELRNAHQELQNRQEGYRFGQEQDYYNFLKTPQGQAAFDSYRAAANLPQTGPMTNPNEIKEFHSLADAELQRRAHEQATMAEIIHNYQPLPGIAEPPWITRARQILGEPSTSAAPAKPTPAAAPAPSAPGRGAFGTFMHEVVPPLVGGGSAMLAAKNAPGNLYVKGAVGLGAFLLGDRLARMYGGELTPEEQAAHPTAAGWGQGIGMIGGTLLGGGGFKGAKGGPVGQAIPPLLPPGGARVRPGGPGPAPSNAPSARVRPGAGPSMAQRFSQFVGSMKGGASGAVETPPSQWRPSISNVTPGGTVGETPVQPGTPYTSQMFPTGSGLPPGGVVPPVAAPPSMSNVPSPVANYLGPMMRDPRIMKLMQQLYKKAPIPPGGQ